MHSKLALCTVAMLLPASALAQVTIRPQGSQNSTTYTFMGSACSTNLTLQWTAVAFQVAPAAGTPLKLWATAGGCDTKKGSADIGFEDVPYTTLWGIKSGTFSVNLSKLPSFAATSADGGTTYTCGDPDVHVELTNSICGAYDYYSTTGILSQYQASSLTITYDTKPPGAPTLIDVSAEDSAAKATFSFTDNTTDTIMAYAEHDGAVISASAQASAGFVHIEGLTNDVTYQVSLKAMDAAGNLSDPSADTKAVTPMLTDGFFKVLKDAGSTEPGGAGCSTTGATLVPMALAALALARALFRRSRR